MIKWRDVVGYEGSYQVSNTGQVRGCLSPQAHGSWLQIKPTKTRDGVLRVTLYDDRGGTKRVIAHLVLLAFKENDSGTHAKNLDGNRNNNHIDNLEWVDRVPRNQIQISDEDLKLANGLETFVIINHTAFDIYPENSSKPYELIAQQFEVSVQIIYYIVHGPKFWKKAYHESHKM